MTAFSAIIQSRQAKPVPASGLGLRTRFEEFMERFRHRDFGRDRDVLLVGPTYFYTSQSIIYDCCVRYICSRLGWDVGLSENFLFKWELHISLADHCSQSDLTAESEILIY